MRSRAGRSRDTRDHCRPARGRPGPTFWPAGAPGDRLARGGERTMTIERYDASGRMSRAVGHANLLFLGGLTADDLTQDTAGQTRQILAKIDHYLTAGGSERSRLLSAQIWLRNISDFDQMNAEWDVWVDRENPPARATVEARLAGERYL